MLELIIFRRSTYFSLTSEWSSHLLDPMRHTLVKRINGAEICLLDEVHFIEGLRLPLPTLGHQFFYYTRFHLVHTHINIIQVLLGVCVMNRRYNTSLRLEGILYVYTIKRHNVGSITSWPMPNHYNLLSTFPT